MDRRFIGGMDRVQKFQRAVKWLLLLKYPANRLPGKNSPTDVSFSLRDLKIMNSTARQSFNDLAP